MICFMLMVDYIIYNQFFCTFSSIYFLEIFLIFKIMSFVAIAFIVI